MKHLNFLYLGLSCVLILLVASTETYATGTAAGTVIKNIATMNYKDLAGNSFAPLKDSVTTTVLQVYGVTVTPTTASQFTADGDSVFYAIQVTNTGNGTDHFPLSDVTTQSYGWVFYKDADHDGKLSQSEISAGPITATEALAEDSTFHLIAVFVIPANAAANTVDQLTVTATSAGDITGNTKASGMYTTTVVAARMPLTKNTDNSSPVPGSSNAFTYTIGYHNTGNGRANSVVLTDTLSTHLAFVSASNGGTLTSNVITWSLGNIVAGASGSVTFLAYVKDSVASGTTIDNTADVAFVDSANGKTLDSSSTPVTITVSHKEGINVTITAVTNPWHVPPATYETDSIDVGMWGVFKLVLTNNANHSDNFSLDTTHTRHFPTKIYLDNGDGTFDPSTDALVNYSSLGSLTENQSAMFWAVDTILHSGVDLHKDTMSYKFTSLTTSSVNQTVTGIAVVRAPIMSLSKAVDKSEAKPGETLTYTVSYSNAGHGAASSIVISDVIPAHTTFVNGSIKLNGVTQSDTDYDGTAVTVTVGTVAEGTSGNISFQVVIQ